MGIFDFFKQKDDERLDAIHEKVKDSFGRVHSDISEQRQWISHIYSELKTHRDHTNGHLDRHTDHLGNLNKWVSYLHDSNKKLKEEMELLEKDLYRKIRKDFILYNQQLLTSMKSHYESLDIESIHNKMAALEQKVDQMQMLPVAPPTPEADSSTPGKTLNSTQQSIISMLYSSSIPLSYEAIALKLDISVVSARVYIKKLKDLGFDIETITSGRKALLIMSNKEKANKFYSRVLP